MIKLSELSNDTMLYLSYSNRDGDAVMDKAALLESTHFYDIISACTGIYVAVPDVKKFTENDIFDFIERIGEDDTFEDWDERVYNDIKELPETAAFVGVMNEAFKKNITWFEGKPIEIDVLSKTERRCELGIKGDTYEQ